MQTKRTIEEQLVALLKEKNMTITFAESCTGGLLSGRFVNVSGASDVYRVGLVTYANEAKVKHLQVKEETIAKHGVVSLETAAEMALGACAFAGAEVSCAVTGVAGPTGGTPKKPVGMVCMACCVNGKVVAQEHHSTGSRQEVREASVEAALELVLMCLQKMG